MVAARPRVETPATTMNDPYPNSLSIEIDRPRLRTYLRLSWLLSWLAPLSFIGTLLGLATIVDALDAGEFQYAEIPWILLRHVGSGFAIGAVIGLMFYLGLSHRLAARVARSLTVTVDGPFLRIRQHGLTRSDRKLHFRSIVDYATRQDFLMRCFGIEALHMMTTAGGPASAVSILGVQDTLATRDLLSDIDRLREAQ